MCIENEKQNIHTKTRERDSLALVLQAIKRVMCKIIVMSRCGEHVFTNGDNTDTQPNRNNNKHANFRSFFILLRVVRPARRSEYASPHFALATSSNLNGPIYSTSSRIFVPTRFFSFLQLTEKLGETRRTLRRYSNASM